MFSITFYFIPFQGCPVAKRLIFKRKPFFLKAKSHSTKFSVNYDVLKSKFNLIALSYSNSRLEYYSHSVHKVHIYIILTYLHSI